MNVAENLYDYLKYNDKAELIGLGTFYVKTYSAKINEMTGMIEPPKKELSFSREQTGDNGFVTFMAKHEFISDKTALMWIKQYSDSLNEKIQAGRSVVLNKLGKLEKGLLEEYTFTPAQDLNLLDNSFALGTLKNVQTFDSTDDLQVMPTSEKPEQVETTIPQDYQRTKTEIESQIENAKKIKEEQKVQETSSQTQERIIEHSEATINTTVEQPKNKTSQEIVSEMENNKLDNTTDKDNTQQTIDRAAEFTEKVIVEDIKPAQEQEEQNQKDENEKECDDLLMKQATEIVRKYDNDKTPKKKGKQSKHTNKRKRNWLIVLWIIIVLLILCGAFVFTHWFGLLKDIKFLKPVTSRLEYYIPVRKIETPKAEKPLVNTQTETVSEIELAIEQEEEVVAVEPKPIEQLKKTASVAKKQKNLKEKKQQETQPAPQEEVVVEDNTPIVVQNHSKLGFDVVSGSFADKSKAQERAKKARSLGYDGYVISKIKNGSPIYYVSYGSRRTNSEATDLCTMIKNRLSGDFYIISR